MLGSRSRVFRKMTWRERQRGGLTPAVPTRGAALCPAKLCVASAEVCPLQGTQHQVTCIAGLRSQWREQGGPTSGVCLVVVPTWNLYHSQAADESLEQKLPRIQTDQQPPGRTLEPFWPQELPSACNGEGWPFQPEDGGVPKETRAAPRGAP